MLDQRLVEAVKRLESGDIKLLSLDVFDTMLGRRVPQPPDVFLRLGALLLKQGLLCNGQMPDSFAATRYQTEYARRAVRQKACGDREITLTEIYENFPRHIVRAEISAAQLVTMEIAVERELGFANPDVIALARQAKRLNIRTALISNTYLDEADLIKLVADLAPDLPPMDAVFVSSHYRKGKRDGLMQTMLDHFNVAPHDVLHVGDNPVSDRKVALDMGINFIDTGAGQDGFDATLIDEHKRQWHERTACYALDGGDFGMTWLRKQSSFWPPVSETPAPESKNWQNTRLEFGLKSSPLEGEDLGEGEKMIEHSSCSFSPSPVPSLKGEGNSAAITPIISSPSHQEFYRYGTRLMGPLLTGFTGWAAARLKQEKAAAVFGLLREGDFLTQLIAKHDPAMPCGKLAVSRLTAALSCFTPDHPAYLEDFLTRRGFWPLGTLIEQLGFTAKQAALIDDPAKTLADIPAPELTQRLITSPLATELFERSASKRARLLRHMKTIGALENDKLFLLDLGYAATIQRGIQRLFDIEKLPIVTHGLYLAAAHVSLGTQLAGGIVEGFLAQNGNPNDFACAFCRSPEIVEISCMPAYGTVEDYSEDGTPLFSNDTMPARQITEVQIIQRATLDFADRFLALAATCPVPPDFANEGWRQQMRALALRIVVHPTLQEAELMGHWMADSDMGLTSPRPIVSAGAHQDRLQTLSATELAALARRDVPWLFGVAATLSYAHCRQVARLIMRHETPEAF